MNDIIRTRCSISEIHLHVINGLNYLITHGFYFLKLYLVFSKLYYQMTELAHEYVCGYYSNLLWVRCVLPYENEMDRVHNVISNSINKLIKTTCFH